MNGHRQDDLTESPVAPTEGHDCGCGCGGTGGCGESQPAAGAGAMRRGRRKFLISGITLSTFAASLASRPAHAACTNLTGLYSPSGSHTHSGVCNPSGKSPGFWKNHGNCWPSSIKTTDTFSKWFGAVSFTGSGQSIAAALCNSSSSLAYQIAAGLLNAESSHTFGSYGYGTAQAFANAVIAAFQASPSSAPSYSAVQTTLASMNGDSSNSSWCTGTSSVCS